MRFIFSLFALALTLQLSAQCDTWVDKSNQDEIMEWHTVYRQAIKDKDFKFAEEYWQKVFDVAPAADGKRSVHFLDGIEIFKNKLKTETDAAKKEEYKQKIIQLYDDVIACYKNKTISIKGCEKDDDFCYTRQVGMLEGRKGYDMYYTLNSPYEENIKALFNAIDFSGNEVEYVVFTPLSNITVYQYEKGKLSKEKTREIYENMDNLLDLKIDENGQYVQYFKDAKVTMENTFKKIEGEIFDCEYFKVKLRPDYEADPDNPELIKYVAAMLKKQGCPEDDPFYAEVATKWSKYAAAENAKMMAEYEAKNPSVKAKRLYDEGKFSDAVAKYKEAIDQETDDQKKAGYYFSLASIQFRKLNQYNSARTSARKAAELRSDWGRPYLLIGDMYAKSSRSCGDEWGQRLAILAAIDKYSYAKSIDASVTDEANKKINIYSKSKPTQDMGFMRGKKKGDTVKVGCWINENVRISYQ